LERSILMGAGVAVALASNQRRVLRRLAGSEQELAGIEVAETLGAMACSRVYAALAAGVPSLLLAPLLAKRWLSTRWRSPRARADGR
jgi:hypothetical protein